MSKLFLALMLLVANSASFAQETCAATDQSIVVFFQNGTGTTVASAKRSVNALRKEIGDTYNDQKVRYDLAYNKTDGMVDDLIQASRPAALSQWNSQVMGWLNGIGAAPDWFNQWYQKFVLSATTIDPSGLPEHVDRYSNAIALGQKAVVVAHSQGNLYVNEAKKLMQQKLPADRMRSFAVFGVAVPSVNVGGASGPYYTNHRDFISTVPAALPWNWTLKRADGGSAQDVDPVRAHLFNDSYLSIDFDLRPALVSGIKAQMEAAQQPTADCTTYRPQILSMVAGAYDRSCGNEPPSILTISQTGVTWPGGGRGIDMTGPDSMVSLGRDDSHTSLGEGATWDGNGVIQAGCGEGDRPPSLGRIEITKTMMALIQPPYQLFPVNSCWVREAGVSRPVRAATPVVIAGTTVYVGNASWDFGDKIASETVVATRGNETMPHDYDPGFTLIGARPDGTTTLVQYRRNKGLRNIAVLDPSRPIEDQIILSCNFH